MNIVLASMHGSGAVELAMLCAALGVDLYVLTKGNSIMPCATSPKEIPILTSLGAKHVPDEHVLSMISDGSIQAVIGSSPSQLQAHLKICSVRKTPLIIRHGLNSFSKFKTYGVLNFISPSRRALNEMSECNCFLSRKLLPWNTFSMGSYGDDRHGAASFIHYYDKHWPDAKKKFDKVASMLSPIPIEHYGFESPFGVANDLDKMGKIRTTIHLKDGQVCCNAVIRSLAMGTPVVMDAETFERCYFDEISGLHVKTSLEDVAAKIRELATMPVDEFDDLSKETHENAKRQFSIDDDLLDRFKKFLECLR